MPLKFDKPKSNLKFDELTPTAIPTGIAEFAGGVTRGMARAGDFFTTNPINEISGLVGSDFRVPTFEQGAEKYGGRRNFMEPGLARDVTGIAGEWAPALATMRPNPMGPQKAGKELLEESAPSIQELKQNASRLYDEVEKVTATIPQKNLARLVEDIVQETTKKGNHPMVTPKANAAIDNLVQSSNKPMTVGELETARKIAGGAASDINKHEAMVGRIVQKKIDDFMGNLPDDIAPGVGETLKRARKFHQQGKKAETIEEAVKLAGEYRSGYENGLRLQFSSIKRRIIKGQLKGWTPEEIAAVDLVAKGGKLENIAKALGKFGISEQGSLRVLIPGLGGSAAYAVGNQLGGPQMGAMAAGAMLTAGQMFRNLAGKLTDQNARLASALVRSGASPRKATAAYMANTPKAQQKSVELAALLSSGQYSKAALNVLQNSKTTLVANAAYMASLVAHQTEEAL